MRDRIAACALLFSKISASLVLCDEGRRLATFFSSSGMVWRYADDEYGPLAAASDI